MKQRPSDARHLARASAPRPAHGRWGYGLSILGGLRRSAEPARASEGRASGGMSAGAAGPLLAHAPMVASMPAAASAITAVASHPTSLSGNRSVNLPMLILRLGGGIISHPK